MPSRRAYLASLIGGTVVGLAGCNTSSKAASQTTTKEPTTETTTAQEGDTVEPVGTAVPVGDSATATLHEVSIQRQFTFIDVSHFKVGGEANSVYLLVRGTANLADHTLELQLGNQRFTTTDKVAHVPVSNVRFDREQVSDPGLYAFDLPTDLGDGDASIVLADRDATVGWSLSKDTVSRLLNPPSFENVDLVAPDSASKGDSVDVTVSVKNAGGSDGTFLAELGPTTHSDLYEIYVDVSSQSTGEVTKTFSTESATDDTFTLRLKWGYGGIERTVELS
jgi:hypothetical protein